MPGDAVIVAVDVIAVQRRIASVLSNTLSVALCMVRDRAPVVVDSLAMPIVGSSDHPAKVCRSCRVVGLLRAFSRLERVECGRVLGSLAMRADTTRTSGA
ncbi:MAG: hypothetical protein K2X32_12650 [Phycisphaerales bacterium]|nr:hypothetical protein [Phycisphaerales bacterium]